MENNSEVVYLYLDDIIPNRFQPREVFDDQALKELAVSIKEHGVIQPIIVRKVENKYEIIAGERRYKASTMAGLTKIPAIVKNLDDKESSKVALIENLQRKDLTPIEEARTYQKILELEDGMTQEQLAATMGKTQSSVSNKLRLLALPDEIQEALLKEKISERHARSLLNIEDKNDQIKMMDKVIAEKMTVRELDKEIKEMKEGKTQDNQTPNNQEEKKEGEGNDMTFGINNMTNTDNNNPANVAQPTSNPTSVPSLMSPLSDNLNTTTPPLAPNAVNHSEPGTAPSMNSSLLTASDIAGEVPTSPNAVNNLIPNDKNESNNSTPPTFNLASLGTPETTPPVSEVAPVEAPTEPSTNPATEPAPISINPTVVDINQVRENSVDIGGNKQPTLGVNELMKDPNQVDDGGFKFVPTFDFDKSNNPTAPTSAPAPQTEAPVNQFSQFFNTNTSTNTQSQQETQNVASSIAPVGLTIPTTPTKDVNEAIKNIKDTISSLETKGYKLNVEENDGATEYKITISLQKNA